MHNKFKLRSILAVSLVAVTIMLAGCGNSPSNTSNNTAPTNPPTPINPPKSISQTGVLRIGSGLGYPPMEYFDSEHQPAGFDVDLGKAIAQEMGVKAEFIQISFAGLIPALDADRIDMIMADMSITPERSKVVKFVPYFDDGDTIVVQAGNPLNIQNLSDLSEKTVAVQLGTTLQAAAESENTKLTSEGKKPIKILTFPQATEAMNQLSLGRVSAVLLTNSIAKYYAKQNPTQFLVPGKPFNPQPVGIAINMQNTQLEQAVSEAVKKLKADGTLKKIESKYLAD